MGWIARIFNLSSSRSRKGRGSSGQQGDSREDLARLARAFIAGKVPRAERQARSTPRTRMGPASVQLDGNRALRTPNRLLLRFGDQRPEKPGVTANVSATGMFVITDRPARPGSPVSIDLRMPGGSVFLAGVAAWRREKRSLEGSVGFGVRLTMRPPEYVRGICALQDTPPQGPESAAGGARPPGRPEH